MANITGSPVPIARAPDAVAARSHVCEPHSVLAVGVGASAAIGFPARYARGLGNDSYVVRALQQQVLCDGVNTSMTCFALTVRAAPTAGGAVKRPKKRGPTKNRVRTALL
jgi:hypothetical protein